MLGHNFEDFTDEEFPTPYKKHPIDYEFSEPDRSDLIYRFAKPGTKEGMEKILNEKKAEA